MAFLSRPLLATGVGSHHDSAWSRISEPVSPVPALEDRHHQQALHDGQDPDFLNYSVSDMIFCVCIYSFLLKKRESILWFGITGSWLEESILSSR